MNAKRALHPGTWAVDEEMLLPIPVGRATQLPLHENHSRSSARGIASQKPTNQLMGRLIICYIQASGSMLLDLNGTTSNAPLMPSLADAKKTQLRAQ